MGDSSLRENPRPPAQDDQPMKKAKVVLFQISSNNISYYALKGLQARE